MRKLLMYTCLFLLMQGYAEAQNRSIHFVHASEVAWKDILKQAKKERKMIFMDCYTSWCGPCKRLANEVFTLDSVADFYNEHFVCVKYDAEKDKDRGYAMNNPFGIRAYPTLLYMDARGNVVHCMVGAYGEYVIREARKAMDPENNLTGLKKRFDAGEGKDRLFFKTYVDAVLLASQPGKEQLVTDYLNSLPDDLFCTAETWDLINKQVKDVHAEPFVRMLNRRFAFDSIAGKKAVDYKLMMSFLMVSSYYTYWKPGDKFDEEKCNKLMALLQTVNLDRVPVYLAEMAIVRDQYRGDYRGILNTLRVMTAYNAWGHYLTTYLDNLGKRFATCSDVAILNEGLAWVDTVLKNEYLNSYQRKYWVGLKDMWLVRANEL